MKVSFDDPSRAKLQTLATIPVVEKRDVGKVTVKVVEQYRNGVQTLARTIEFHEG